MRRVFAPVLLIVSLLLPSAQAFAWNHKGHMTVAFIAYQHLTPQEKAKVVRLLRSHPDFPMLKRLADQLGGDPGQALFVTAARWPDLIRNDNRFFDETKNERPTRQLPGFPDMMKHRPWHFKDEGFSPDGTRVEEAPADNNAEDSIRRFREFVGARGRSEQHRAYYLAWLEHLVGDVHQPLHCTARFTRAHPHGDGGGNLFKVAPLSLPELNFQVDNLHSVWDDILGDDQRLADIRALAAEAEASNPEHSADELDEDDWIDESFALAKRHVYASLVEGDPDDGAGRRRRRARANRRPPPTLTQEYLDNARAVALRRVKLAGRRLAGVIKADLR